MGSKFSRALNSVHGSPHYNKINTKPKLSKYQQIALVAALLWKDSFPSAKLVSRWYYQRYLASRKPVDRTPSVVERTRTKRTAKWTEKWEIWTTNWTAKWTANDCAHFHSDHGASAMWMRPFSSSLTTSQRRHRNTLRFSHPFSQATVRRLTFGSQISEFNSLFLANVKSRSFRSESFF